MNKRNNKSIRRTKVIPDKLFHKIWDDAQILSERELVKKYTSIQSSDYIAFEKKYNIDDFQAAQMIKNIKTAHEYTFKDILELAEKRKADISHIFCIPIRTIEDWYSGKSKCAPYIKLILLRKYHLLYLGKYIYLESEIEYKESIPRVYKTTGESSKKAVATKIAAERNKEFDIKYLHMDKREEAANKRTPEKILEQTDYLKDKMEKWTTKE